MSDIFNVHIYIYIYTFKNFKHKIYENIKTVFGHLLS